MKVIGGITGAGQILPSLRQSGPFMQKRQKTALGTL
jgi:hypothetical protein